MVLASNTIIENEREIKYSKNLVYNFEFPKEKLDYYLNFAKNNKLKSLQLYYDFPSDFNIDENYQSEAIINYTLLLLNNLSTPAPKGKIPTLVMKEDVIAVPIAYALGNNLNIGDKIEILGKQIEIIGFTDLAFNDSFVTTQQVVNELKLSPNMLKIYFFENIRDTDVKEILNNVMDNLEPSNIYPEDKYFRSTNDKLKDFIILLVSVSILSLIFIYTHLLNMRKKKYFIFRFNGMQSKQFYFMLLIEILFIYLISFVLALVLFYLLDVVILKNIFGILRYDLKISSILLVFVIYLIILVISMSFNIRRYFKTSLVESYKG
ncbi:FtsX-like permease family protein [Helcococcus kunzii]